MQRLVTLARIIGLLGVAVALTACSAIKLGYNTLPQFSAWWLDGYVDFSVDQQQRVREDIARLHQWHRRDELPKLSALLLQAERMAAGDITADQACAMVPALRQRLLAVAEGAAPAAVTLALNLSPEQLAHIERKYQKNVRDYRKEWLELPLKELQDKRFEQYLDRTEMIYGRMDEAQRAIVRSQTGKSVFDVTLNLQERLRRQQDILQVVRKIAGQPVSLSDARTAIDKLLQRGLQSPDPQYHAYQEALIQESCRTIAAVHNSTTAQQRQSAGRRLRAYRRDLDELAAQP